MEVVVDTNALSAWLDGDPGIAKPLADASALLLSPVALGEYRFGLLASRERASYESKLQQLEKRFGVLVLDAATATFYAEIRSQLKANGTPIPMARCLDCRASPAAQGAHSLQRPAFRPG